MTGAISFLQPHIHKPGIPSGVQGGQDAPVTQGRVAVYSGIGPVKGGIIAEACFRGRFLGAVAGNKKLLGRCV